MELDIISREEFDRRLEQSTERMRQQRLVLEARAAELEDLIGRYASVLERIEAASEQEPDGFAARREELRNILTELAERTSAVAAAL
jgi:BMFP domain-containing protein YqiC